jgi:hypothetical protein
VALTRAFNRLEESLWELARTSHDDSLACLAGTEACRAGARRFSATVVQPPPEDAQRVREAVTAVVLPAFRDSCNRVWAECSGVWNRTVGQARGYQIP